MLVDLSELKTKQGSLMEKLHTTIKEQYPMLSDAQIADVLGVNKNPTVRKTYPNGKKNISL